MKRWITIALCALASAHTSPGQVWSAADIPTRVVALRRVSPPGQATKQSASQFASLVEIPAESREILADDVATLADGTATWGVAFRSEGAKSMSLCLEDISLPAGGSLTVSDTLGETCSEVWVGPGSSRAMTPTVFSDAIVLRYAGPARPQPRFRIVGANCGFRSPTPSAWGNKSTPGDYNSSASCEVPVACKEDMASVSALRRGVCRLILNGRFFGTGTLVNNTAQDRAPLVVTAAHVVGSSQLTACEALFGFEEPTCANDRELYNRGTETIVGGTLAAFDAETDMAVIRLPQTPSLTSRPYWMGWSRTAVAPTDGDVVCVHHPYGDAKKISVSSAAAPSATYTGDQNATGGDFAPSSHWFISRWSIGATEGGSSGAPLMTAGGKLIGSLTGGAATCRNPVQDYFWMFSKAWNASSDGYPTLCAALDPGGMDPEALGGLDYLVGNGATGQVSTFSPSGNDTDSQSEAEPLDVSRTAYVQPISPTPRATMARSYWAVTLYASAIETQPYLNAGSARVEVGVSSNLTTAPTETASVLLSRFRTGGAVTIALPNAVSVGARSTAYVHVTASGFTSGNSLTLMDIAAQSDNKVQIVSGSRQTVDGKRLMLSAIVTEATDTAMPALVSDSGIRLKVADGVTTVYGAALRLVAVYDRGGRLVAQTQADGRAEVSLDMCGHASGLYVVRALAEDGAQSTFKLLNY